MRLCWPAALLFVESPTRLTRKLLTHLARQPLRLPLRYAHRGPLHPGRYGPGCPVPPCTSLRERCSRLRRSPLPAPARLKSHATRPLLRTRRASCLLRRRRAPQELATLEGRPPGTAGFVVAAAKLRPTVAVLGESGVLDDVTAAARQRQAARRRARLPSHREDAARRHRPNVA